MSLFVRLAENEAFNRNLSDLIDHLIFCFTSAVVLVLIISGIVFLEYLFKWVKVKLNVKEWREAKEFIVEDICIFTLVLLADFGSDYFNNFLFSLGLIAEGRPNSFGFGQIFVALCFGGLLIRKIKQLKYFSPVKSRKFASKEVIAYD